jgi:UPF0716 family protein affecting phage T7 exclusion
MQSERYTKGRLQQRYEQPSLPRRIIGWGFIGLGFLGIILPALPGIVFIAIGILLLGPYDPGLRRIALAIRLVLRRWSQMHNPLIRRLGWSVRRQHRSLRLAVRSRVARHQRGEYRRRDYLSLLIIFLLSVVLYVGVAFAIHFGVTYFS